jgi:iron complex transport system substrate-binding protein
MRHLSFAAWVSLSFLATPFALAGDFTDSAGRLVHLPEKIAHVIPAGPPADALIYALAPDLLDGLVEPWSEPQKSAVLESAQNLPAIPRLTGKPSEADLAALRDLHPDLIIDYGDVNERYAVLADKMQETLGVPYILLSGTLDAAPVVIRSLGKALGREDRAEEIAGAIETSLAKLAATSSLPEDARVPVYYARGSDGLRAVRPGSSLDAVIELAGGRNVVPGGQGIFASLRAEDVLKLNPEIVIVTTPDASQSYAALRKALPQNTRFLIDPGLPYGWVERPPSLNRIIGALWLASKLHPDKVRFSEADAGALAGLLFHKAPDPARLNAAFR